MGKTAVGIKIFGTDGQPPSGGKALLHYLGYILNGILLSIGFLWAAFDGKRQGWHDGLAGTYVVYSGAKFSDVAGVWLEPAGRLPGWVWLVLWVVLALTVPTALAATIWGLGPNVARLLANLLGGWG